MISPMRAHSEMQLSNWLKSVAVIRYFEEGLSKLYPHQIIRCPVHLAIGHEGSAVGVCAALEKEDQVLSYHRSHHHFLAKGGLPEDLLYELLGDERGCSGGRGGSTHLYDPRVGFSGSTAIIGGTLPVASGIAHALKIKKSKNIVVAFCGDAAVEEGVFFETLNLASLWNLPLLLVIEDNDLSCYTEKKVRQGFKDFSQVASLYNAFYSDVDGSNTENVFSAAKDMVETIRTESRPGIMHVKVFRAHEHCGPDQDNHLSYRQSDKEWPAMDPLRVLKETLSESESTKILEEAKLEVTSLFNLILSEKGINVQL